MCSLITEHHKHSHPISDFQWSSQTGISTTAVVDIPVSNAPLLQTTHNVLQSFDAGKQVTVVFLTYEEEPLTRYLIKKKL